MHTVANPATLTYMETHTQTKADCLTNEVTGVAYQGGNIGRLTAATLANGYNPDRGWAGFKQWLTAGRVVRKGEHGTPCLTVVEVDEGVRKPRGFTVFHYSQTEELNRQDA